MRLSDAVTRWHCERQAPSAAQVIEAGANAIVAGSAVFKAKSYRDGKLILARFIVYAFSEHLN